MSLNPIFSCFSSYKGLIFLLLITGIFTFSACQQKPEIDFSTQVKPILNNKCISCHGGVKKQGGLSFLFEEEAFAQLESGKYGIVKGEPHQSEMIIRLTAKDVEDRMPYEEPPLSKEEIDILTQWVKEGAKWGEHWAYQSVEKTSAPKTTLNWGNNKIDQYIGQKIVAHDLSPSPAAAPVTLARRLSLDLIGYPAPSEMTEQFLNDPISANYEALVDNLLAMPAYGEKWASMWLDLARYADTKGYERDPNRNIWRYRDWLIKAFNEDMPYDQFLTEQLAGDLLPEPTDDQLIATAFHRNTMTNDEGGTNNEEFRTAAVLDRVNTTWEVLMSTSFACAQCHSHPYDPFTQKEYYQFNAYFNNTRDEDTQPDYPLLRHYNEEQLADLQQVAQWLGGTVSETKKEEIITFLKTWSPAQYSQNTDQFVRAELADTKYLAMRNNGSARLAKVHLDQVNQLLMRLVVYEPGGTWQIHLDSTTGPVIGSLVLPKMEKPRGWNFLEIPLQPTAGIHDLYFTYWHPKQLSENHPQYNRSHVRFDWFYFKEALPDTHPKKQEIEEKIQALIEASVPTTPIMLDNPPELKRKTHLFERGNWLVKGEEVQAAPPASLNPLPDGAPANRLGLAQWMTAPDHPLTSRTIVNRVWEQLYGFGLVETLEDLGTQGASATHQELLDYLSWTLMNEYQWSLKTLLKSIVLSATYQQSSKVSPAQLELDPNNVYLARMPRVRLSAEQIRDQALAVCEVMNEKMYGKPVMPFQPEGIWMSPYNGAKWKQSKGDQRYRRAIYTYWKRTSPYPSMITFDGVGREVCSSRRIRTNTPLQALATLNDPVFMDLSKKLILHVWEANTDATTKIKAAYQQVTNKEISAKRLAALEELYESALADYEQEPSLAKALAEGTAIEAAAPFAAMVLVANTILNLDEVIMKG